MATRPTVASYDSRVRGATSEHMFVRVEMGQPSATARAVAAHRLSFKRLASSAGDPAADDRLQADVASGPAVQDGPFSKYLARRTLFFDTAVVEALSGDCTQVVVVGAGYDGRSMRYARDGVEWFELDHPATSADKDRRLRALGLGSRAHRVPVDFERDDVRAALLASGFDPTQTTSMMCEGVTPYLEPHTVAAVLRALRDLASGASTLAIDFALHPRRGEQTRQRSMLAQRVNQLGEPFRFTPAWGTVADLLLTAGWRIRSAVDPAGRAMTASDSRTAFVLASPSKN